MMPYARHLRGPRRAATPGNPAARLGPSFGAVSQHLKVLESAGLVARREEGRFHLYVARRRELGHLGKWLEAMWDEALSDLKRHAESEEKTRRRRRGRNR